jgi:uncharacterized protein YcgI (DUF1989 family)
MTDSTILKGGTGVAIQLRAGQSLSIINTHGTQVVDCWAFKSGDPSEFMSMPHCRNAWFRLSPKVGDSLVTNLRNPILKLIEDSSPGVHDTLVPSCDEKRYRQLGFDNHASCTTNFNMALRAIGVEPPPILPAINLFMNVPIQSNGTLGISSPVSRAGDKVRFSVEMDCIVILSACPHDIKPVMLNGPDCTPRDVDYVVDG